MLEHATTLRVFDGVLLEKFDVEGREGKKEKNGDKKEELGFYAREKEKK